MTAVIADGNDDVEQKIGGSVSFDNKDLDIRTDRLIGLRYYVCVPSGASILNASLTFTADEEDDKPTTAGIRAERSGDAAPFAALSPGARPLTTATTSWADIEEWDDGTVSVSPDLSAVVAEVVGLAGWNGCGYMVFVIEAEGDREAVAFETDPATAPVLRVTYSA